MKFGSAICIVLDSENLICRSTDISKCFIGSLQLRNNESRLYFNWSGDGSVLVCCLDSELNLWFSFHLVFLVVLLDTPENFKHQNVFLSSGHRAYP